MAFAIRPTEDGDVPQIVALLNSQTTEPTTEEDYRRHDRLRPKEYPCLRVVAVRDDGTVLGLGVTSHEPSHDPPGEWGLRVRVGAPYQGQGVGSALLERVERFAVQGGAVRIVSGVRSVYPEALRWAEHRGYRADHYTYASSLDLHTWSPEQYGSSPNGVRITTLAAEGADEAGLRRYLALYNRLLPDVPGLEAHPEVPFDLWIQHRREDTEWNPAWVHLAVVDGQWVGLSQLNRLPSGDVYTVFTAVLAGHRGRGIALALKVAGLTQAKAAGVVTARTHNHSGNRPMIAVNERLGYVAGEGVHNLVKVIRP